MPSVQIFHFGATCKTILIAAILRPFGMNFTMVTNKSENLSIK